MCAHLGWSWHDLHHSISWPSLQKIMLDQAKVIDKSKVVERIEWNEQSAQSLMDAINQKQR